MEAVLIKQSVVLILLRLWAEADLVGNEASCFLFPQAEVAPSFTLLTALLRSSLFAQLMFVHELVDVMRRREVVGFVEWSRVKAI